MALIQWDEKFSVKIPSIDAQHKKLFDMINELGGVITQPNSGAAHKIVAELVNYTVMHFMYEENLLEEHHYTGLEDQREEHDRLTGQVMNYKKNLESGQAIDLGELQSFMLDWLSGHILESDMKYSEYLTGRGVQ